MMFDDQTLVSGRSPGLTRRHLALLVAVLGFAVGVLGGAVWGAL